MRLYLVPAILFAALTPPAVAADFSWVFRPSYYSHNPASGERAIQYSPENPAYFRIDPTYQQSAYRHVQDSIVVGDSSDHLHIVETWGRGDEIRPYGEWLYPFRPGAAPYGPGWYGPSRFGPRRDRGWDNYQGFGSSGTVQGKGTAAPESWENDQYGWGTQNRAPAPGSYGPRPIPYTPPGSRNPAPPGPGNGSGGMPPGGLPNGTTRP